jgi:excisionase family DNA binding protein
LSEAGASNNESRSVVHVGSNVAKSKLLYRRKEAAELLSFALRTLDYLIKNRRIAIVRVGRRVLITRQELERFSRHGYAAGTVP